MKKKLTSTEQYQQKTNKNNQFLKITFFKWPPPPATHSLRRSLKFFIVSATIWGGMSLTALIIASFKSGIVRGRLLNTSALRCPHKKSRKETNLEILQATPRRLALKSHDLETFLIKYSTILKLYEHWAVAPSCWNHTAVDSAFNSRSFGFKNSKK